MNKRCAVILRGQLRTFKITYKSLLSEVVDINNADIFITTYQTIGQSNIPKEFDNDVFEISKYKGSREYIEQDAQGGHVTSKQIFDVYGKRLKKVWFYNFDEKEIFLLQDLKSKIRPIDIDLDRTLKSYLATVTAVKNFKKYCIDNDSRYDFVILARPDLQFYSELNVNDLSDDTIYVPETGGNINLNRKTDSYFVAAYKNVERREYIPFESQIFNDQIICSSMSNLLSLCNLIENIETYEQRGVPTAHPESLFFYHMAYLRNKKVELIKKFHYEILRNNFVGKINIFTPPRTHVQHVRNIKQLEGSTIKSNDDFYLKKAQKYHYKCIKHWTRFTTPFKYLFYILRWPMEPFVSSYYYVREFMARLKKETSAAITRQ